MLIVILELFIFGIENFLREIFPFCIFPTALMRGDNSAANSIGNCLATIRKVRHLSLASLWIRKATEEDLVKIEYVPSKENTADLLTKVLGLQMLDPLLELLSMFVVTCVSGTSSE